jgi:hypothetical protein
MNTLIYGMHWKSQTQAIKELNEENIISVKVWIGKNKENDIDINKLRRVKFKKEKFSGYNQDIYDKVYKESFDTFLDMFSRNPAMYNITHQEAINLYNYFFDYFSKVLFDNKIELMIFHMFPHFGSDYLLTVIAKHMNIKMILMYQSLLPNRFNYVTDLDDYGKFDTSKIAFDYPHQTITPGFKKTYFYMKNIKLKYKSCFATFLIKLRRYLLRSVSRMTFLGMIQSSYDCFLYKYLYNKLAQHTFDKSKKFVYFPLQMQPELTTSTIGGIYTDQLLAIEKIVTMIPSDWTLYVKENPKQLEGHRGKYFYERLSLLKNVVYLSKEVSSFDLIDNCQFVANVTGTVGWEALQGGKPAIVFGQTWYQEFPGAIRYRNDLNIDEILNTKIDFNELEVAYNKYALKTANGIVDRGYIPNFPEYTDENNAMYLKDSLERIIKSL